MSIISSKEKKKEKFNMVVRVNLIERLEFKISLRTKFSFKNEGGLFGYLRVGRHLLDLLFKNRSLRSQSCNVWTCTFLLQL